MSATHDDDARIAQIAFVHGGVPTAVFDLAATGTFGRIVEVNHAFARCFGRDREELTGMRGESIAPDFGTWGDALRGAAEHGTSRTSGITVRARGRLPIAADLLMTAVPGSSYVVAQLIDRSSHERGVQALRESERRLQEIVDNVHALVWVKDLDGRYLLMNRRCQSVFGIAPGMTDLEWAPEHAARDYVVHDQEVIGLGRRMEFQEDVYEGGVAKTHLSLKFPLYDNDGRVYAIGGVATDISAVKQAEIAASEARDAAEQANRAKSEFLSRMSHELRTPLNSILGYAQLLSMDSDRISAEDASGRILAAGAHLLSMIDEVLAIARIEEGADEVILEPIHACDPLVEAVEIVRPIADARDMLIEVDLHGGVLTFLRADHRRLKQVLINLIANAVRYNREGEGVLIAFERDGDRLRFCVSDRGEGLSADDEDRVFAPFGRLDQAGTEEGTGLGLAVSRALMDSMGGSIWYRDRPGGGTTFVAELSVVDAPADAVSNVFGREAEPPETMPISTPAHVLYVEDNPYNVEVVRRALSGLGPALHLDTAANAAEGMRKASEQTVDVVLLDLHLPDGPGREIIRQLRASEGRRVPIIVLSADATREQIDATMSAGADVYLTKPLDLHQLVSTVSAALPS